MDCNPNTRQMRATFASNDQHCNGWLRYYLLA